MWGLIESWFPGLRRLLEESSLGIVETPADMQAESDADGDVLAAVPADPPPSRPTEAYVPEVGKPPEIGPRMTPPPPADAAAEPAAEPFLARVPADRALPPVDLLESLRAANARLRRERDQAVRSEQHMARQLAAARQLHTDLRQAGIRVVVTVDAAGAQTLRLTIPGRDATEDLLFELPPLRINPLHKVDGITDGGGRPSGPTGPGAGRGATVAALPEAGQGQAVPGGQVPDAPL